MDDALRASEVLLASALDLVSDSSLVADGRRRTIYCNRAFTAMTGYTLVELLGNTCAVLQGPDTDRRAVEEMRATLDEGLTYRGILLNYRRDGTTFWNELTISPVRDWQGAITNFVSVQRELPR